MEQIYDSKYLKINNRTGDKGHINQNQVRNGWIPVLFKLNQTERSMFDSVNKKIKQAFVSVNLKFNY